MRTASKVSLSVAASALVVGLLAGCGATSQGNTTPAGGSGASTPTALVLTPGPYGSYQANFNPFSPTVNAGAQGLVYEPLYFFNTVGPQKYPLLAQSYSWSNNDKTLTVQLRQNVKWTDGQPFSSNDVKFTFDMLKAHPSMDTSGVWTELASVAAPNPDTVVFTFQHPDVPFAVYVLETYIVPEHIWSSIAHPSKYLDSKPIGTGPFILSSFTSQDYKLTANPNYYLGKPHVPEVDFPAYADNNGLNLALAQGKTQWGGNFIPNVEQVFASKSPHNHYWFPPYNMVVLYPNLKDPLLNQLPVRQAISLGINRAEISQKGEDGYENPASPTGLTLPTYQSWVDPSLSAGDVTAQYDPTQAEQILQQAGFKKNSSGVFVAPSGKPLSFTLQVPTGWSDWDADCELIKQQLAQVGIHITVDQVQFAAYTTALKAGSYQLALSWTNAGPNPYYQYYNMLDANGNWNVEGWSNAATNTALQQFSSTTDATVQHAAINTLETIMSHQLPAIPVVYGALWYEYNDSAYTGWPTQSNPYVTPAPYSWPAPEIVLMHLQPRTS